MTRHDSHPDIALVARAIGEPARAAMLQALVGGQALSAGELSRRASVAPATATAHLRRLVESGLVVSRSSGRHRFFALAGADAAAVIEALACIASASKSEPRDGSDDRALRFARTCYDHLAGALGVMVTDALLGRGIIAGTSDYQVSPRGEEWLASLDIDVETLRNTRRSFVRPCLDWSERRPHVAGAVGAAIAGAMLERRWLARIDGTRAVRLTLRGREGLYRSLGLQLR